MEMEAEVDGDSDDGDVYGDVYGDDDVDNDVYGVVDYKYPGTSYHKNLPIHYSRCDSKPKHCNNPLCQTNSYLSTVY